MSTFEALVLNGKFGIHFVEFCLPLFFSIQYLYLLNRNNIIDSHLLGVRSLLPVSSFSFSSSSSTFLPTTADLPSLSRWEDVLTFHLLPTLLQPLLPLQEYLCRSARKCMKWGQEIKPSIHQLCEIQPKSLRSF